MTPVSVTHRKVRSGLLARAYAAGAAWALSAMALVLVLAWLLAGPEGWRPGSVAPLALDVAGVIAVVTILALGHRGITRWLDAREVASNMDQAAGLPSGTVMGSLELSSQVPEGVSEALAARAQRMVSERLGSDPNGLSGRLGLLTRRRLVRGLVGLAVLAGAVVALGATGPERSKLAWAGLMDPVTLLSVPELPALSVRPGDAEVLRGTAVVVEVEAAGRTEVTLTWRSAGQLARHETHGVHENGAQFTLPAVTAPVQYWVTAADGSVSPTFELTPVDPLFVSDLRLNLTFPSYTGRIPEEYRGDVPPLRLPLGTRIQIDGRASRPLGEASLQHDDPSASVPLALDGDRFDVTWTPRRSGTYAWRFTDTGGGRAESAPMPLELTIVGDSAPHVELVLPGKDTVLALSLKQPLAIQVSDDYGVSRIELVTTRISAFGERSEPVVDRLDLGGVGAALARPILDLSEWGLLPGDTIRYLARAVDNAPSPQVATTREYVLRMPGATELNRDAQRRLEEAADQLEELAREAERVNEEARELERQSGAREGEGADPRQQGEAAEGPAGFQEREQFQQALDDQEALASGVDSLSRELNELSESVRDAAMDPELKTELEELQTLLEELLSDDVRQRMRELSDSLQDISQDEIDQALQELTDEQEAFRERLEESLERFRRAAVEQDFRATTGEAEELAQQERAMADALEEGTDPGMRAEQQDALEERAEELGDRMETLEERLQRLGEEAARQQVEQARQEAEQSRQAMRQAADQARSGNPRQGAQQAQSAATQMDQAAQQLSQAQQQMAQQMAQQRQEAFQQTASDAIALSRQQAEVRESMRGTTPETMADLRGDQAAVSQGIRAMAENLSEAGGGQGGEADREVMQRMGEALSASRRTLEAMDGDRNGSPSPRASAEMAMEALNDVALMAMAAGGQQGQGEGSGDAQQQMTDALESLAQQQGSLMNQTGSLVPLQLGEQARRQQMQQIAQGQEQVADDLGDLSDEPDPEAEALGDLEAMAREARALSELLARGRLDPETLQRQERLFHRLLDAGRTLERDEQSDERESQTAGAVERQNVLPLTLEALDAFRYALPDGEALSRLPPAQRQLVIDYFERLNRERPRGGGRR